MKKILTVLVLALGITGLAACSDHKGSGSTSGSQQQSGQSAPNAGQGTNQQGGMGNQGSSNQQ